MAVSFIFYYCLALYALLLLLFVFVVCVRDCCRPAAAVSVVPTLSTVTRVSYIHADSVDSSGARIEISPPGNSAGKCILLNVHDHLGHLDINNNQNNNNTKLQSPV